MWIFCVVFGSLVFVMRHFLPPTPPTRPWLPPKEARVILSALPGTESPKRSPWTLERDNRSWVAEVNNLSEWDADVNSLSALWFADVKRRSALLRDVSDSLLSVNLSWFSVRRSVVRFSLSLEVELETGVDDRVIWEGLRGGWAGWLAIVGGDVTERREAGGFWSRPQQTCKKWKHYSKGLNKRLILTRID